MPVLDFRRASVDDVPSIIELVTAAYRGDASRQGWTTEADLIDGQRIDRDVLLGHITDVDSLVLLGELAGGLVGCVHVSKTGPGRGYVGMFAIDPGRQGGGLGKQLLAEAERVAAAEWDVAAMTMSVLHLREELFDFYERRGYRRTGRTLPFPYGDKRFGVPKRDDLRLEVLEKRLGRD